MPELPEIFNIARQMQQVLPGKTITDVRVLQEKCLNAPSTWFTGNIIGRTFSNINSKGKWLISQLSGGFVLLINLGMGGDIRYHPAGNPYQGKCQFCFSFQDKSHMHIYFSWFGYVHLLESQNLHQHGMTARLGISPFSPQFTLDTFKEMLSGRRGGIKAFLMNQHHIAGIGNVYIQDILFKAGLHPLRPIPELSATDIALLHQAIISHLRHATEQGGLIDERDFFGNQGQYTYALVGHRPGKPCPICQTPVQVLRTGSTRSYICEKCQT